MIVLNANEEFAYIGYIKDDALKFGYVSRTDLITTNKDINEMSVSEDNQFKLRTTNKNVPVFKFPTIYSDNIVYRYAQGDIITSLLHIYP